MASSPASESHVEPSKYRQRQRRCQKLDGHAIARCAGRRIDVQWACALCRCGGTMDETLLELAGTVLARLGYEQGVGAIVP